MKKVYKTLMWFGYAHEVFHFIPAALFGMKPKLYRDHIEFEAEANNIAAWKMFLVVMLPSLVGLPGLVYCVYGWISNASTTAQHFSWFISTGFWFHWVLMGSNDFRDLKEYLQTGFWQYGKEIDDN